MVNSKQTSTYKFTLNMKSERKEREAVTEALLKLLEDACVKIDKNFK
jgi:hypothetical protein